MIIGPIAEIAGLPIPASHKPDGVALTSLLRGQAAPADRHLYWHYPHYQHYQQGGTKPGGAVRAGRYKLIEFYDDWRVELYDIRNDISEQRDLAAMMPDKVAAMRQQLHDWRKDVDAQMPTKNPAYDPSKPEYTPPPATQRKAE